MLVKYHTERLTYQIQPQCKSHVGRAKSPSASLRWDAQHLGHYPGHIINCIKFEARLLRPWEISGVVY